MKSRLIAIILTFWISTFFSFNTTFASELVASKCKVEYKPGGAISLSFPRASERLATTGEQKHLIVAIDFSDSKFTGNVNRLIEASLDPKKISDFYSLVSYGKLTISFDTFPEIITLPNTRLNFAVDVNKSLSGDDNWNETLVHQNVINLLDGRIDLSKYSAIHAVLADPEKRTSSRASAFVTKNELRYSKGFINNATLIGGGWLNPFRDSNWWVLAHEIGHLFGLQDLYMYNGDYFLSKTLGGFDLMMGGAGSLSFISWHRWLQGWLSENEVKCLDKETKSFELELNSTNSIQGTKSVMIPLTTSKVLVVESRRNEDSRFFTLNSDFEGNPIRVESGILVYLVDLSINGGEGPVRIIPEENEKTTLPVDRNLSDSARFRTATLAENEYVVFEGLVFANLKSQATSDLLRIRSGSEGEELIKDLTLKKVSAKAEADAKAKAEADAKARAEADAKARAEADAKARAEADAKARAEADAKARAEADANLKYDAVLNQYRALMERIRLLKIKYPTETSLNGLEAKMMNLPIIKGSDLGSAIGNINSVNSKLDASEKVWEKTQKTTISCVKGKITKKVTAVNPKCPFGYKKK